MEGEIWHRSGDLPNDVGRDDLPTFGRARDPRRGVHGLAEHVALLLEYLAGVQADAYGDGLVVVALDRNGRGEGVARRIEHGEVAVAQRLDHSTTVRLDEAAHDLAVGSRMTCAAASPTRVRSAVEPTMSVNITVSRLVESLAPGIRRSFEHGALRFVTLHQGICRSGVGS